MKSSLPARASPWPHRLAVCLALATFPLIWVGGLVTTYDAGMAVPDWPTTYGYNLLRYPWQTWLAGPFDLFIEHGHRLLGALAGLLSLLLLGTVLAVDRRPWLVAAAAGCVALVVLQGVLGGLRVLWDARLVALVHGCVGPLFFAYLGGLIVATGRPSPLPAPSAAELSTAPFAAGEAAIWTAWGVAGLAYGQLVLGAILRHVPVTARPELFRAALAMHLLLAAALWVAVVHLGWRLQRSERRRLGHRGTWLLVLLVTLQMALGAGTYVAKYAFPAWLGGFYFAAAYVVREKSLAQSLVTTAHVANGSLILFLAVVLAMRLTRQRWAAPRLAAEMRPGSRWASTEEPLRRRLPWLEGVPT